MKFFIFVNTYCIPSGPLITFIHLSVRSRSTDRPHTTNEVGVYTGKIDVFRIIMGRRHVRYGYIACQIILSHYQFQVHIRIGHVRGCIEYTQLHRTFQHQSCLGGTGAYHYMRQCIYTIFDVLQFPGGGSKRAERDATQ